MAKKPDWLYKQSAVVPYIRGKETVEIVLVTSSSNSGWVLPKGVVETSMSPEDSAAKEALEEAGVLGTVSSMAIDEYEYEKWGGICRVKVYPLEVREVLEYWDEMEQRDRVIVGVDEAIGMIKPQQRASLEKLKDFLGHKNA